MLQGSHVEKKDIGTAGTKNVLAAQEACLLLKSCKVLAWQI